MSWQDRYRQLKARRNAIDNAIAKEVATAKKEGRPEKLTSLRADRKRVVEAMNDLIDKNR